MKPSSIKPHVDLRPVHPADRKQIELSNVTVKNRKKLSVNIKMKPKNRKDDLKRRIKTKS